LELHVVKLHVFVFFIIITFYPFILKEISKMIRHMSSLTTSRTIIYMFFYSLSFQNYFSGITGGKMYSMKGSGVTTLCLPHDPDSLPASFQSPDDGVSAFIFGAEYEMSYKNIATDDDVPCAVCHAQTSTSAIMIPAKLTCPQNWKLQYNGFMSAERYSYFASDFICVDLNPQYIEGTRAVNADGRLIHPVKARCGSLPCPPYKDKQLVSCVVCAN
jgi:hypothetical protein